MKYKDEERDCSQIEQSLKQVIDMNRTLRSQRHDFINHMQVIWSLLKMSKFHEANAYIEKLYGEIQDTNQIINTGLVELNALFHAKAGIAEANAINLSFEILSDLSTLNVPVYDLIKIMGNLLDNAIYATSKSEGERNVHVHIYENATQHVISIANSGPIIALEIHEKIFEPEFSTKQGVGEGLGLYITKVMVTKYGGHIYFESNQLSGTNFMVTFPKVKY